MRETPRQINTPAATVLSAAAIAAALILASTLRFFEPSPPTVTFDASSGEYTASGYVVLHSDDALGGPYTMSPTRRADRLVLIPFADVVALGIDLEAFLKAEPSPIDLVRDPLMIQLATRSPISAEINAAIVNILSAALASP